MSVADVYDSLYNICIISVPVCKMSVQSVHIVCIFHLLHTWLWQQKSVQDADLYTSLHHFCWMSASVCIKSAISLHFSELRDCPRQSLSSDADSVQNTCRLCRLGADFVKTLCTLFLKSLRLADYADFWKVCKSACRLYAHFLYEVQSLHKVSNQRE